MITADQLVLSVFCKAELIFSPTGSLKKIWPTVRTELRATPISPYQAGGGSLLCRLERRRDMPETPCVHHWLIDLCNKGVCKKCGATRDFRKLQQKSHYYYIAGKKERI